MTYSFEAIYKQYYQSLVRYYQFKTQNLSDSEEIANDVMLKVFKHINDFNPEKSALQTWIFNISKNTLIDYFRSKNNTAKGNGRKYQVSTDSTVDEEFFQVFQVPDKGIKADSLHDSTIANNNTLNALNGLKGINKDIAVSYFLHELNYQELVEKYELPLTTIKVRINRIREKLQSQLINEYHLVCI